MIAALLAWLAGARADLAFALGADEPQASPAGHAALIAVLVIIALLLATACANREPRCG